MAEYILTNYSRPQVQNQLAAMVGDLRQASAKLDLGFIARLSKDCEKYIEQVERKTNEAEEAYLANLKRPLVERCPHELWRLNHEWEFWLHVQTWLGDVASECQSEFEGSKTKLDNMPSIQLGDRAFKVGSVVTLDLPDGVRDHVLTGISSNCSLIYVHTYDLDDGSPNQFGDSAFLHMVKS